MIYGSCGNTERGALKRTLIECISLALYPTEVHGYIVHFFFFFYSINQKLQAASKVNRKIANVIEAAL